MGTSVLRKPTRIRVKIRLFVHWSRFQEIPMRLSHLVPGVLILLALLLIPAQWLLAQANDAPLTVLTDSSSEYSLERTTQVLRDANGQLSLADVRSPAYAAQFETSSAAPQVGTEIGTDWIRFRVRNDSSRNDWMLQVSDTRIPYLDVYRPAPDGTGYAELQTGDYLPISTREIPDRTFLFHLNLPPQTEETIYLRARSNFGVEVPIFILTPERMMAKANDNLLAFGLFYGAMLIMAGYNLIVFIFLKDRAYFYLVLVILGLVLSKAAQDGVGHQYLWGQFSNRWTMEYSILFTLLAVSYFTSSFLQISTRAPVTNRVFNGWRVVALLMALLVPFLNTLLGIAVLMGVEIVMILLAAWRAWQSGHSEALLFLMSLVLPLVSGIIFLFYTLGVLPNPYFADRILLLFLAALALFWSLVLVERFNAMRSEMQVVNRNLAYSERKYRSLFQDSLDAIFITKRSGEIIDLNPTGLDLFGYTRAEVEKMNAVELFEMPEAYVHLQQILEKEGFVLDYEAELRRQDGSVINAILSSTLWEDDEHGVSGYQGILRDVTEGRRTQAELANYRLHLEELVAARTTQANAELAERRRAEATLERRVQELSALNEIAKTISTVTEIAPALTEVARQVTQLFNVGSTFIGEMHSENRTFRVLANYPPIKELMRAADHTLVWDASPIFERVLESNKMLLVTNPHSNPLMGEVTRILPQAASQTLLWIPLRVGGTINGILVLCAPPKGWFADGDILDLAETIGTTIATAIENTRLYQQAKDTAIADERQRLGRELHDSATQLLYSIVLLAEGHGVDAEQNQLDGKTLRGYFNELGELGQQALGEMRLLLFQLHAPVLTEIGLRGALQQRLTTVEQRAGIQTYIYMNGDLEALPLLVQQELYFIAQEALNNALRHARASEVQLRLVRTSRQVEMVVQDNGNGFERGEISEGMGLRNMQARARMIDAKLEIKSYPGQGTRVQLDMTMEAFEPA